MTSVQRNPPALIHFDVDPLYRESLRTLPWEHSVEEWKSLGVRHLDVKRGMGRHPVVFVEAGKHRFVVKELGHEVSRREVRNYKTLLERGVHTLIPVGCVVRTEGTLEVQTRVGRQYEPNRVGHTVTLLIDRVLPDSQLYRRSFRFENRMKIWDAVVDLFVDLHTKGVFWGDASLANTLVRFLKVDVPHIGPQTRLKAYLADAETVEIHNSVSDALRAADVQFFLESMDWINEDLRAGGVARDALGGDQDRGYILETYQSLYEARLKTRAFERETGLDLSHVVGHVRHPEYIRLLEKHIAEHKWYLSESKPAGVSTQEATRDWLDNVFLPVTGLFKREGVMDLFPGRTAAELYVEVMTHKYYVSTTNGKDIGMVAATRDYARRFGGKPSVAQFWRRLSKNMALILGLKEESPQS